MKLLWIAQIAKHNSYSKVSMDYIETIRNLSNWDLRLFDISNDTPQSHIFNAVIEFQPDFVIILHNASNLRDIVQRLATIRSEWSGTLVGFVPIDMAKLKKGAITGMCCQNFWTMNNWASTQIGEDANVGVLEHIVEDYYQFSERKRVSAKKKHYGIYWNRFIVGMVNANNCRKRLDLGIHAFRLFQKRVPNSLLVIKTTKAEKGFSGGVYEDWNTFTQDLPVLILDERYTEFELNELYNSFDLIINPTDGEGFGMTPFEAALSGVLSIVPLHTSFLALLPEGDNSRFCLGVDFVPCEYARTAIDYLRHSRGGDKMLFASGVSDGLGTSEITPFKIPFQKEVSKTYTFSSLDQELYFKTMEDIIDQINRDRPSSFQIAVTSDLESLRLYLDWSLEKGLTGQISSEYSIVTTSSSSIMSYVGRDQPVVGIIDPQELSDKMMFYYLNPDVKLEDVVRFQQHVKEHFNSKKILDKMTNLLKELLLKKQLQ